MADLGIQHLPLFLLAGWALNLTPGPDVFYQITHALKGGVRAGIAAMLGILAGCLVHVSAAALGVSALVAASSTAFTVLKWIGAAYLVYVGIRMMMTKASPNTMNSIAFRADFMPATALKSLKNIFIAGFWTNALNPKVALFFLAFLPQFISPSAAQPTLAFALLGLIFILNSIPVNLGYVLLAAWVSSRLQQINSGFQRGMLWLERAAGALFVGFGIKLALSEG
jgi:threonine/homoserine/homoserine lactone efflux protein